MIKSSLTRIKMWKIVFPSRLINSLIPSSPFSNISLKWCLWPIFAIFNRVKGKPNTVSLFVHVLLICTWLPTSGFAYQMSLNPKALKHNFVLAWIVLNSQGASVWTVYSFIYFNILIPLKRYRVCRLPVHELYFPTPICNIRSRFPQEHSIFYS